MGSMPPEKIVAKPIADRVEPEPILLVGAVKGVGCHPTLGLHVVKNPGVDEGEMFNTIVSETFRKSLIVVIGIHEHREHDLALIDLQTARLLCSFALLNAGSSIEASIAMMAMTTSNSIKVNPRWPNLFERFA